MDYGQEDLTSLMVFSTVGDIYVLDYAARVRKISHEVVTRRAYELAAEWGAERIYYAGS